MSPDSICDKCGQPKVQLFTTWQCGNDDCGKQQTDNRVKVWEMLGVIEQLNVCNDVAKMHHSVHGEDGMHRFRCYDKDEFSDVGWKLVKTLSENPKRLNDIIDGYGYRLIRNIEEKLFYILVSIYPFDEYGDFKKHFAPAP